MDTVIPVVTLVLLLCIGIGLFVVGRRRPAKPTSTDVSPHRIDLSEYFESGAVDQLAAGDLLVYPTDSTNEVLVFGSESKAQKLGTIVQRMPQDLARAAVGADVLMKVATVAGEQGGLLVRLTKESTQHYNELQKMKDVAGATMGVLRQTDGKFAHVIRFKAATGLQRIGGVTGALQGMALQSQLASMEKAIGQVADKVEGVQSSLDWAREADARATRAVVMEVYRASQATGTLTPAMWDQIAPLGYSVRRLQEYAKLKLLSMAHQLEELEGKKVKQRRTELTTLEKGDFERAFANLQHANRTLAQFHALRMWHLIVSGDPALRSYQAELLREMEGQGELLRQVLTAFEGAVGDAGERGRVERILSPFDARRLERAAQSLLGQLDAIQVPAAWSSEDGEQDERRELPPVPETPPDA
jgi:hypothetical protein